MRSALVALLVVAACGGESAAVGPAPAASGAAADPGSPRIVFAVRGVTTPVAHPDAFSGQTPTRQILAIKSLTLYRTPGDASPLKVLDLGGSAVEADLVVGATVDVGAAAIASLTAGTYTRALVGASYVRYSIASRMHATVVSDGRYDNIQALSDGAMIDGQVRAKGWFHYAYAVGGVTYGALEGANAPLPQLLEGGGMGLETVGADSFYAFPITLTIDPATLKDGQRMTCVVNVHESFRWQDQELAGYAPHVYDSTPTTYEPVVAFGASGFSLTFE